jgi:O-antigen/teichoic acid export membrane protein
VNTSRRTHLANRIRLVASLAGLQLATQALGLVSGFFLLRWLSVRGYAEYTFAFAFGSVASQVVDLGFLDSLVGLIGERAGDQAVIGSYMRAAMSLRTVMCAAVIPLSGIPFVLIASSHGWPYPVITALFGSVLVTLVTRTAADYYTVPILLARKYRAIYGVQAPVAALRFACNAALRFGGVLTGWLAAAVNAAGLAVTGFAMKRRSAGLVTVPRDVNPAHRREIVRVVAPLLPNQIFAALQGQITVLIISITGRTSALAQVGALGRLAQLFVIVSVFNVYLIAPVIARVGVDQLATKAAQVMGCLAAALASGTALAFIWPTPLLWFLGPHYHGLAGPARWYVLGASLNALGGTAYTMSVARKFIWWRGSIGQVLLTLVVEAAAGAVLDLHRVLDLQYFAVVVAFTLLAAQLAIFAYGVRRGPPARIA